MGTSSPLGRIDLYVAQEAGTLYGYTTMKNFAHIRDLKGRAEPDLKRKGAFDGLQNWEVIAVSPGRSPKRIARPSIIAIPCKVEAQPDTTMNEKDNEASDEPSPMLALMAHVPAWLTPILQAMQSEIEQNKKGLQALREENSWLVGIMKPSAKDGLNEAIKHKFLNHATEVYNASKEATRQTKERKCKQQELVPQKVLKVAKAKKLKWKSNIGDLSVELMKLFDERNSAVHEDLKDIAASCARFLSFELLSTKMIEDLPLAYFLVSNAAEILL